MNAIEQLATADEGLAMELLLHGYRPILDGRGGVDEAFLGVGNPRR